MNFSTKKKKGILLVHTVTLGRFVVTSTLYGKKGGEPPYIFGIILSTSSPLEIEHCNQITKNRRTQAVCIRKSTSVAARHVKDEAGKVFVDKTCPLWSKNSNWAKPIFLDLHWIMDSYPLICMQSCAQRCSHLVYRISVEALFA